MASDPKLDLLRRCTLFAGLGERELDRLGQLADEVDLPAGHVLMRQGDTGNQMFVLAEGRVRIERDGQVVDEVGPGAVLGEVAILSEGPRTATVTTTAASKLFVLGHREFHALLDAAPSVRASVLAGVAERLRNLEPHAVH
jgi:CRP-like cAMP-binding protein